MEPLDFVAVGDIVTEPFIRLKDARVTCKINDEDCEISMRWGDKIPYEFATICHGVGNSPNAAVAAARLGLKSGLISDIGRDTVGKHDLEQMGKEGVSTTYITAHEGIKSNYHYVLWYENERTILVKHEAYPYQFPKDMPAPKFLYLSSLADHSEPYHMQIAEYLAAHPETKLAFQPGTFQMKLGAEKLKGLYERTHIFFCNKEEAQRILELPVGTPLKELLAGLRALGPKLVVITDDRNGAYASDGTELIKVPMYPDSRAPYERTGAGDAFAATATSALALDKPFAEALLWAPINSMAVVQEIGAQKGLLSRAALEEFLKNAPPGYCVSPL